METYAEQFVDNPALVCSPSRKKISYTAYGVRITLEADVDLLRYLPLPLIPGAEIDDFPTEPQTVFRFFKTQSANGQPVFVFGENDSNLFCVAEGRVAAQALESRIHHYVAALTDRAVFVHAGVVSWRGRAIIVPGPSHTGKSTLVLALVELGMTYYSDEYAVIDFDGYVHAFPRQLRLRPDVGHRSAIPIPYAPEYCAPNPVPVGWVLKARHNVAGAWDPKFIGSGQTLLALLENTVAVRRQSELTVRTLKRAVGSAIGLESERAEAIGAAQEIMSLINDARPGRANNSISIREESV